jgi:hypothetical protein
MHERTQRPFRVKGCRCGSVGSTSGVPQTAADLSRRPTRQPRHKRTLARDAHRVLWVAAYEVINVPQSFRQWFSVGVAPGAPEAETS